MEQNWAKTRSGLFPERTRNTIAKLQASLEELDMETISLSHPADLAVDICHISTTTSLPTPANTATSTTTTIPTIHKTTTTWEWLDCVTDMRHVTTPPTPAPVLIPVLPHALTTTTATSKIRQQDNTELREDREEK